MLAKNHPLKDEVNFFMKLSTTKTKTFERKFSIEHMFSWQTINLTLVWSENAWKIFLTKKSIKNFFFLFIDLRRHTLKISSSCNHVICFSDEIIIFFLLIPHILVERKNYDWDMRHEHLLYSERDSTWWNYGWSWEDDNTIIIKIIVV